MHNRCTNYRPGHAVHWIQAGLSWKKPGEIKQITVLGQDGHWLIFEMDEQIHRVWNHDPEQLREFHDAAVKLQAIENTADVPALYTSVNLLRVPGPGGIQPIYPSWDGPSGCTIRGE